MATTVTDVFNIAMGLTDNLTDNADYKARIIHVINNILPELYQYSDAKTVTAGTRPVPLFVGALTDTIALDDTLAKGVLPHGVIAALFTTEDPSLANYHEQKYMEKLVRLRNIPNEFEDIEDVYGVI
jgi:hypothetical protein